jgi:hypothetical protein
MSIFSGIKVSLTTNNKVRYSDGEMTVKLSIKDAPFDVDYTDSLFCSVYAEDYYPMCTSKESSKLSYKWPTWTARITCSHIWLPGNYTLLIRESDETLTRAELTVDQRLSVKVKNIRTCQPLGLEDVLDSFLQERFNNWQKIACIPGTGALRQEAVVRTQMNVYNELRKEMDCKELKLSQNLLIESAGVPDLKDDTLQRYNTLIAQGMFKRIDCSTLYDVTCNNPYESLTYEIDVSAPTTLCLTNLNSLHATGGKVIVKRIVEKLRQGKEGDFSIWLYGTRQEIDGVLDVFPSVKQFFNKKCRLELKPYTAFELVQTFYEAVIDSGVTPSVEATDMLARAVMKGHENGTLANWRIGDVRRFVADEILPRYISRTIDNMEFVAPALLEPVDIEQEKLSGGCSAFEQSIRELKGMVGLENIKRDITTMANRTKFFMERRRLGLPTNDKAVFHAIFTGNPGTGKTTVARMLGKIYHSLGLLSKGDVISLDRTHIVGRFIGETEDNMKLLLEEARGNVLFIDEAYNLHDGATDRKDYGCRAIDSLLTVLAQPNPDMLIVFAGYEKEMDAMLSTNPGLFGRFPYKYRFDDYSADQLMQIACQLFSQEAYLLTDEARDCLFATIKQTLEQRTKNFGNARWIEQYVRNGIIPALADRISALAARSSAHHDAASPELYQTIEAADVKTAYEKFNPKTIELRPRRQVGFSA